MHPFSRRRLPLAGAAAALAAMALAGPAQASSGDYTTMLCANPDTAKGTAANDGVFPDGVRMTPHLTPSQMTTLQGRQACSGTIDGSRGMLIATNGAYSLGENGGASFTFELPQGLAFKGATIYARTNTSNGMVAGVMRNPDQWIYASPSSYLCQQPGRGCAGTGTSVPFSPGNAITIGTANTNMERGFQWYLRCGHAPHCNVTDTNAFAVYGGKVSVGDDEAPSATLGDTGITGPGPLRGDEEVSFTAADEQSGVYRSRFVVDSEPLDWERIADRPGCADVNAANDDDYEFGLRRPCPLTTSGAATLDTTELTEGRHRLRLEVEDAAGNTTTLLNRNVDVDNLAPPQLISGASLQGTPKQGGMLAVTAASWSNGGVAGAPAVERRWLRCDAAGEGCAPLDATGTLYEPTAADVGRRLRVVETATNSEGSTQSRTAATEPIAAAGGGESVDQGPRSPIRTPLTPASPTAAPVSATARSAAGTPNGDGASQEARLTVSFTKGGAKGRVDYGGKLVARGRLVDAEGRPIRNAIVDVGETAALRGAKAAAAAPVVTGSDGSFTFTATGRGGTRELTFSYRYLREGAVVARASVVLTVRAQVKLAVKLRGVVATYTGRVLAGSMPRGGKLVIVQGRALGGTWQTFASRRADKKGTFKGRYRLKVRRPGKRLQFRVRVVGEAGWNYAGVTSRAVTRRVK